MRARDLNGLRDEFYNKHPELKETIEILEVDTTIITHEHNRIIVKLYCKKHNEIFYAFSEDIMRSKFYGCSKCAVVRNYKKREDSLAKLEGIIEKTCPEYELISYSFINMGLPLFLRCKKHKILFLIYPTKIKLNIINITRLIRCPLCSRDYYLSNSEENIEKLESFMDKVHKRFPHFSIIPGKTKYINNEINVWLHCDKHNIDFQVCPGNLLSHMDRCGCPICGSEQKAETRRKNEEARLIEAINKYDKNIDTSRIIYKNSTTKVILVCKICNKEFQKTPNMIYSDIRNKLQICTACRPHEKRKEYLLLRKNSNIRVKTNNLSQEEFIARVKEKFPHYKVIGEYINRDTKVLIKCEKHNITFLADPGTLLHGKGIYCPECIRENRSKTFITFLEDHYPNIDSERAQKDYINLGTPIKLFCKIHKEFITMSPATVMSKSRNGDFKINPCPKCSTEQNNKIKLENWILKFNEKYPNHEFDFNKSVWVIENHKAIIKNIYCKSCKNYFDISPFVFLANGLCKCCDFHTSFGETCIYKWLIQNNIKFQYHVRFSHDIIEGKFDNSGVEIDFILNNNIWIEYNGEQHYSWCKHLQPTVDLFEGQLRRDNNVRKYCNDNNITLIEIPWTIRTVEEISKVLEEIILKQVNVDSIIEYPKIQYKRTKAERGEK